MYVLTVTNFADTCSGRADTVSVYDTYDDARAVTPRTTAVDDLTVDVICHDDGTTGSLCDRVGEDTAVAFEPWLSSDGTRCHDYFCGDRRY